MTDNDIEATAEDEQTARAARRTRALHALQRLNDAHLSVVPQAPSQYMCAVGAQVGGVDLFTARRIYRAMVAAAYERPTIN